MAQQHEQLPLVTTVIGLFPITGNPAELTPLFGSRHRRDTSANVGLCGGALELHHFAAQLAGPFRPAFRPLCIQGRVGQSQVLLL